MSLADEFKSLIKNPVVSGDSGYYDNEMKSIAAIYWELKRHPVIGQDRILKYISAKLSEEASNVNKPMVEQK